MNRLSLMHKFLQMGFTFDDYSLYGEKKFDQLILEYENGRWKYYEMGEKWSVTQIKYFATEDEACNFYDAKMFGFWKYKVQFEPDRLTPLANL